MFSRMMQMVNTTDSLYLSPPQQKELLDYAKSVNKRFAAVRTVEDAELKIIDATLERFQEVQPTVGDLADAGWDTAADDLRYAVRAVCQGVLMDDIHYAELTALGTLRTTLGFLDLPGGAAADLFAGLRDAVREAVPPDAAGVLMPFFDAAAEVMDAAAVG